MTLVQMLRFPSVRSCAQGTPLILLPLLAILAAALALVPFARPCAGTAAERESAERARGQQRAARVHGL